MAERTKKGAPPAKTLLAGRTSQYRSPGLTKRLSLGSALHKYHSNEHLAPKTGTKMTKTQNSFHFHLKFCVTYHLTILIISFTSWHHAILQVSLSPSVSRHLQLCAKLQNSSQMADPLGIILLNVLFMALTFKCLLNPYSSIHRHTLQDSFDSRVLLIVFVPHTSF